MVCQKASSVASWLEAHLVPFPVVPDEDRTLAKLWGVYQKLSYDAIHIARPATFVVDSRRVVRYVRVSRHQADPAPLEDVIAAGRAAASDTSNG